MNTYHIVDLLTGFFIGVVAANVYWRVRLYKCYRFTKSALKYWKTHLDMAFKDIVARAVLGGEVVRRGQPCHLCGMPAGQVPQPGQPSPEPLVGR